MAKVIMVQGTMSNAGKSVLAAGLCRVFKQDGYKVAPFKSQNMALNSFITEEGLEMGRAQVMQAEAAGVKPAAAMNPILLKPTNDTGSQVILNGEVAGVMSAAEYFRRKQEYIPVILDAFHTLEKEYDMIVVEGAGSPAEINLKENDIVNMGLAEMLDAPVLLVGDIDRGGVFAQLVGTMELLEADEKERIVGTVINKFRGDVSILEPGLRMLEEKIHRPVLGVIPYFHLDLDEEDSLTERFDRKQKGALIDIAVIRFPRISNFTDLMPLECLEGVSVRYVTDASAFGNPDAVILPGSKNTMDDLLWMRQNGLEAKVLKHASADRIVFGICGGYQMLGEQISDPEQMEHGGTIRGMGLLPTSTIFQPEKRRTRIGGTFSNLNGMFSPLNGVEIEGYEIHMGKTIRLHGASPILNLTTEEEDGAACGSVCGCYIHGIFDRAEMTQAFLSILMCQKGMDLEAIRTKDMAQHKEEQYDKLAEIIRENLDMERIYKILEKGAADRWNYPQEK